MDFCKSTNQAAGSIRPSRFIKYHGKSLEQIQAEILSLCDLSTPDDVSRYLDEIEAATAAWACISSKTQRSIKPYTYEVQAFESVTKLMPIFRNTKSKPPPQRSGMKIDRFSKRSHSRLMDKFRKMKKENLDLPYFVTLTYQQNMRNFKDAKSHLNTFFQRFRRRQSENDLFRYSWKMEPQKRGAIHFHLMLFLPDNLYPVKWKKNKKTRLHYAQLIISTAWNEVSKQAEGFEPVRSRNGQIFGNMALYAGTNVRDVQNWKMAAGYLSKYMSKETDSYIWGGEYKIQAPPAAGEIPKVFKPRRINKVKKMPFETGRFWGFSNNFDFSAFYRKDMQPDELYQAQDALQELNDIAFKDYCRYERDNLKRNQNAKDWKIDQIKARFKRQKARFLVNKEKIRKGLFVQLEINHTITREVI